MNHKWQNHKGLLSLNILILNIFWRTYYYLMWDSSEQSWLAQIPLQSENFLDYFSC